MNTKNDRRLERIAEWESGIASVGSVQSRSMPQKQKYSKAPGLTYARSLRAIGHSLDLLGVRCFELKKNGEEYLVRVITGGPARKGSRGNHLMKRVVQIVLKRRDDKTVPSSHGEDAEHLRYTFSDIWHLDEDAQSRRGQGNVAPDVCKPSQVLRVIGAYLDRMAARAFTISMSAHLVSLWYESGIGSRNWERFDMANVYDRAIHMLLGRSHKSNGFVVGVANPQT